MGIQITARPGILDTILLDIANQDVELNRNSANTLGLGAGDRLALGDNDEFLAGTGLDAEYYYNGTNLVINPRAVGTGFVQFLAASLGATPADVVALWNATDASAGAQQYSPGLRWHGEGWTTDGAGASMNVDWRAYVVPVQGAAAPTATLTFDVSINDAAFATRLSLTSAGLLTAQGGIGTNVSGTGVQIRTPNMVFWEGDASTLVLGNISQGDYRTLSLKNIIVNTGIYAPNIDAAYTQLAARDSAVGLVEIARMVGAADPYLQIGRDDTGVALNAVTDMLVLQAGGGTGNEAAGQGFGLSVKLGNAASEVEERGSLDLVLVTATNGAEDSRWDFNVMGAGAMGLVFGVLTAGINLASGKVLQVNGTQVVGARVVDARADDVANSGDATTDGLIDALRDAMITHGLIAAA